MILSHTIGLVKRIQRLCFVLLLMITTLTVNAQDDLIFTITDANGNDQVTLDIQVENFTNIFIFEFSINWDPSVLEFINTSSYNLNGLASFSFGTPSFPNVNEGELTASWADPALGTNGESLSDGTSIFSITFNVLSPSSTTVFFSDTPTTIGVVDINGQAVNVQTNSGIVNGDGLDIEGNIYHDTNFNCAFDAENGIEDFIIRLEGENDNFYTTTDINGNFDATVLEGNYNVFVQTPNFWETCDPSYPITVEQSTPIDLSIPIQFTGIPPTDDVIISVSNANGNQDIVVDIIVENFTDIIGAQFSVAWDSTILQFDTLINVNQDLPFISPISSFNLVGQNLNFLWFDQNVSGGYSLPNGSILFSLQFDAISIEPTPVIITSTEDLIIEFSGPNGTLNYETNEGIVNGNGIEIEGNIYHDANLNCAYDAENGIEDFVIRLEGENNNYYATTDENGTFSSTILEGDYTLFVQTPDYWETCDPNFPITIEQGTPLDLSIPVQFTKAMVQGIVFVDDAGDCTYNGSEEGWTGANIILENAETYYSLSNNNGNYAITVEPGAYELRVIPPTYWGTCEISYPVDLSFGEILNIDFPLQALIECPLMEVNLASPFLRRCFDGVYLLHYCNNGTTIAENAYIEVAIDPFLIVNSITATYETLGDNNFVFQLGDVPSGTCESIAIEIEVSCDAVLGQSHCSEARIYPNVDCSEPDPSWSGASIVLDGECEGDSLAFSIQNIGTGDMANTLTYIVIEDNIMYIPEPFQLNSSEEKIIKIPANGSTYRLEADQVPGHPGNSMPSVAIEGCGTNGMGTFSVGFIEQYSQDEASPFVSIDCQANIGAYDPNDKRAFPLGVGNDRLIEANTDIEYMIRFQNTGTDTAFNVVILDELSQFIDPTSVRAGASSHPYELNISADGVLEFRFDNIMLPDSTVDQAGSNGFVQFKVAQIPDNLPNTLIENSAAIYFDFNEPVITNTVQHTIEKPEIITYNVVTLCAGDEWNGQVYENSVLFFQSSETPYVINTDYTEIQVLETFAISVEINLTAGEVYNGNAYYEDTQIIEEYTAVNGCDSLVTVTILVETTNSKSTLPTSVSVFPNPFDQVTIVRIEGERLPNTTFKLYNALGTLVRSDLFSEQEFHFHRNDLVKGIYMYKVESDGLDISSGKLMIR